MDETASAPAPQLVFELSDGIHHVLFKPSHETEVGPGRLFDASN